MARRLARLLAVVGILAVFTLMVLAVLDRDWPQALFWLVAIHVTLPRRSERTH